MADDPARASADTTVEAPPSPTPSSGWAGAGDDGGDIAEKVGPAASDVVAPSAETMAATVNSLADTPHLASAVDPGGGVPSTAAVLDDGFAEGAASDGDATAEAAVANDVQPLPPTPSSPLPAGASTVPLAFPPSPGLDGGQHPPEHSSSPNAEGGAPLVAVVNGIDALDNEETVAVAEALAEATSAASAAITVADVASFGQLWERFHGRIAKYAVGRKYRPLRVAWDEARDLVAAALAAADAANANISGSGGADGDEATPRAGSEAGSSHGSRSPTGTALSAPSPVSSSGGSSATTPPAVALLHLGELGELVARALDVGVHCGKVAIVDVCVDCIHRLLEHGHLGGGDSSGSDRAAVGVKGAGGKAAGSAATPAAAAVSPAAYDDGGDSGSAGAVPSTVKLDINPSRLESAVLLVCGCLETKDEDVYLRMVQTLLTAVTSTRAGLHHGTLLAAVRTVYNIFLNATMPGTRTTARVALTRILQLVFSRMEAESASADTSSMLTSRQAQGVSTVGTAAAGGGGGATDVADSATDASRATPASAPALDGARPTTVTAPAATPELADPDGDFPSILQQDAYLLFRALCKLSAKELDENVAADSIPLRSKLLSLELLRRVVRSSGPAFRSGERFVRALRLYLSPTLLANCLSPSMAVVGVALDIVEVLLAKDALRPLLKAETAALFETVVFRFLEAPAAGPARRQRALALCVRISSDSHLLADLFANYDCDVQSPNLFEKLVVVLSNAAQHGSVSGGSISASSLSSSPVPSGTANGGGAAKGEISLSAAAASTASSMAGSMASLLSASTGFASSTAAAADAADAELRANALSGVVSIVQALRRWSRPAERALKDDPSAVGVFVDSARPSRSPLALSNGSGELGDELLTSEAALGGDAAPPPSSPPVTSPVAGVGSVIEGSDYDMQPFEEAVRVKQLLVEGVTLFNAKPRKGIDLLVTNNVLDRDAEAVAHFLRHTDGLDATSVGEYIGDADPFNVAVMNAYTNAADLTGLTFDASLRLHLAGFRLPGEAQKIDRIMEAFAARFVECNPGVFANADVAFVLGFSTILLNTDAHNPQVKNKMTKEGFLRNNRGINNGGDVPAEVLSDLYDRIVANEIRISDTLRDSKHEAATKSLAASSSSTSSSTSSASAAHNSELFRVQSERLLAQVRQQFARRRRTAYTYYSASNVQHARLMFSSVWMALLAALSQRLHCADGNDISTANRCLAGIRAAIAIASTFSLSTEKVALVGALASFTRLGAVVDMRAKNVAAVRMLLAIAAMEGDHLGEQWTTVVRAVSQLQHVRTLSATTRTRRLSSSDSAPGSLTPSPLPTSPALPPSPAAGTIDAATPTSAATGSLRPSDENSRPSVDEAVPARRLSRSSTSLSKAGGGSSGSSGMDATAVDANAAALARGIDETEIERVFVNSAKLSAAGLGDLFRALCSVSLEELGEPRLFCLVKLVETASLNVPARRSAEWRHLWETILGTYFTAAMCHMNRRVALFAVDALRQLAIKLISVGDSPVPEVAVNGSLEVQQYSDQLSRGHAGSDTGSSGGRNGAPTGNTATNLDGNGLQRAVLRPFESCYARSRSTSVRELVLRCVAQLVAARSSVVQSGWKALFGVLVIAADERSESLLATAFGIVESVVRDHVGNLDDVFVGTIAALSAYAHNALNETVALSAIGYLSGSCPTTLAEGRATAAARPLLVRHLVPPSGAAVVAAASAAATGEGAADGNGAGGGGDATVAAEAAAIQAVAETVIERYEFSADVEAHIGAWFPILTGLASSVSDSRPAVRAAATEGLFRVLRAHGGTFGPSLWTLVFRGVISPLFDDVRHLPGGDRSQRLDSGGRPIPGGGSTGTGAGGDQTGASDSALPLWAAETGASALRALVDVSVEHWLAARHLLPDLLALLRSWVVQETEAVARKGVAALRLLLTGAGTRLSSSEWDAVVGALGGLFKDMSPVEILGPDGDTRQLMGSPSVPDAATAVGSPGDMGSSRNDAGGREHESSERQERRPSGRLERTTASDGTSSGGADGEGGDDELTETRYIDFRVVRAKCVVQLLLVTTVQDTVVCFYRALSTSQLLALADALEGSYQFAHDFNANVELRYSLWRAGFMTQVPNLLKQETSGLAAYFRVLLWLYIDEARGAAAKSAVEARLLALLQRVLGGYVASCEHARSKPEEQREVAALTPVVVLMVRGHLQMSNDQFQRHLGTFFPLLLELMSTSEAQEVRVAVKELLGARLSPLLGIGPTAAAAAAAAAADRRRYRRQRRSNGSDGESDRGDDGDAHRGKVRDSSSDTDERTQPGKSSEDDDHEAGGTREVSSDDDDLDGGLDDYSGDGGVAEFVPRPLLPGAARELVLSLDGVGGRSAAAVDASTALERVPGVTSVVVNVDNGTARVWAAAPEDMVLDAVRAVPAVTGVRVLHRVVVM
ncbi:hypothetical protein MMPV_003050 [Pyropia vietnamensis]